MVKRYLLTFLCVLVIPIFVLLLVVLRQFEATLFANLAQQSLEATQQIAEGINEEAKRIAIMASSLANNASLLTSAGTYNTSHNRTETFLAARAIADQLDIMFNYLNQVGAVFFCFRDKECLFHRNFPISLNSQSKKASWYLQAQQARGKTHILQTFSLDDEVQSGGLFLSCVVSPSGEAEQQGVEMIVVSFRSQVYSDILLRSVRPATGHLLILDNTQRVILDPDGIENIYRAVAALPNQSGAMLERYDQRTFLVLTAPIPYAGMTLINLLDYATLARSLQKYAWYARLVLGSLIVLFSLYTAAFFRSLVRPLHRVIDHMERVGHGDMSVRVPAVGWPEFARLAETFNQMVMKIGQLTKQIEVKEQQRAQAEIDALQSQINPHFLSNTLNAIKMMAGLVGAENIRKMTGALMTILTASFRQPNALTTLQAEFVSLEQYIYIMKVRFGDNFEVTMQLAPEVAAWQVLLLLIQPLLENAILHGVRGLDRQGRITIAAEPQADQLVIAVTDNGVGMSAETLQAIWQPQAHPHHGLKCIGIRNVHERIRLNYGDAYGVQIESIPTQGTQVQLVLPRIQEEPDVSRVSG